MLIPGSLLAGSDSGHGGFAIGGARSKRRGAVASQKLTIPHWIRPPVHTIMYTVSGVTAEFFWSARFGFAAAAPTR
jgi:hypothetical protein